MHDIFLYRLTRMQHFDKINIIADTNNEITNYYMIYHIKYHDMLLYIIFS